MLVLSNLAGFLADGGPPVEHRMAVSLTAGENPVSVEAAGLSPLVSGDGQWTNMGPASKPAARQLAGMVYDSRANKVLLFGGASDTVDLNDVWTYEYANNTWTKMAPSAGPAGIHAFGMAYDSQSDKAILFGGTSSHHLKAETWAYDYTTNSWTNMMPATRPRPGDGYTMAYDSQSDRTILFGGYINESYGTSTDTWAYDYHANVWTNMSSAVHPSGRGGLGMAYDSQADRIVIFGGGNNTYGWAPNDTWAYDYGTNTWTNMSPLSPPGIRDALSMAYDSHSDKIILFGGTTVQPSSPIYLNETWVFDYHANAWSRMYSASGPAPRAYAGMAYDSPSDRTILFGGTTFTGCFNDTWAYRLSPGPPAPPSGLKSSVGNAAVHLTWLPPTDDGGALITNYSIYRSTVSGGEALLIRLGSATAYTDTGVSNGVTHYYQVTATNAFGEGARTGEIGASPVAPNTPPVPSFTVSPASGDVTTSFIVDATASSDTEDAASALQVRWDWQGDGVYETPWSTTKTAQHRYASPGTYTIQLQVQDTGGLTAAAMKQVVVGADTVQPTLAVLSPSEGATLTSAATTISGTASDNVAVQKVEVSLDNVTWMMATGTTSWSATLSLREGANTIYVRVTDTSGNMATEVLHVTVAAPVGSGGLPVWVWFVVAVAVTGTAGAAYLMLRRRKKLATETEPPPG